MKKMVSQMHRDQGGWSFRTAYMFGPITTHLQRFGLSMACSRSAISRIQNWLLNLEQVRKQNPNNRMFSILYYSISIVVFYERF